MLKNKRGTVPIWLMLWGYSKKVWHMCLTRKLKTSNGLLVCWVDFGWLTNFTHWTETVNITKNGIETWVILRPPDFLDYGTFCRLRHLCFTICLVPMQRNHLELEARKWFQLSAAYYIAGTRRSLMALVKRNNYSGCSIDPQIWFQSLKLLMCWNEVLKMLPHSFR